MAGPDIPDKWGIHMIAKAEALQKLKKMGMMVADDASIVTVLLPKEVSFETGLNDVRKKLTEIGYESSFCVKQTKDAAAYKESTDKDTMSEEAEERAEEISEEDKLSEEEISSYMAVDSDGQFSLDDDGQFTLGLEF